LKTFFLRQLWWGQTARFFRLSLIERANEKVWQFINAPEVNLKLNCHFNEQSVGSF